ncbi:hypothetical protein [Streptomyces sp. V3I7]|uniref:hypothetical protein n=1 Tax=Streptomyces sp. V3I7 TaxID=3042278 RepID=UPI00278326AB|nr:hypothetical protein [Streptomyces sp. V3I7]MDQ0992156.1 hypothetical protein [Streptomyces sp. V3I7]
MQQQPPSVGQIAHGTPVRVDGSQAYTAQCRAAIVTAVSDDPEIVGLAVLTPTGASFHEAVGHFEPEDPANIRHAGGTWHWPERV